MKNKIFAVLMSIMMFSSAYAGPFEFEMGMSAREVKKALELGTNARFSVFNSVEEIQFSCLETPEKYHNLNFDGHVLSVTKDVGLFQIRASASMSTIAIYNGLTPSQVPFLAKQWYKQTKDVLKRYYGEYIEYDYLKADSIFDG